MPTKKKTNRCSHIYRSGPLHPSITIGGGVSMGQCTNECFPDLVVCYEHASKEVLALLARNYMAKYKELVDEQRNMAQQTT